MSYNPYIYNIHARRKYKHLGAKAFGDCCSSSRSMQRFRLPTRDALHTILVASLRASQPVSPPVVQLLSQPIR